MDRGRWLGWVGLGLSGISAYEKTREACASGRENECNIARVREGASFAGGGLGGAVGSASAGYLAGGVCLALGFPTSGMGTLACSVVLIGGTGYAVGAVGSSLGKTAGEWGGEMIYGK